MSSSVEDFSTLFFNQLKHKSVRISGNTPRIPSISVVGRVEKSEVSSFQVRSGNIFVDFDLSRSLFTLGSEGIWEVTLVNESGSTLGQLMVEELSA